MPDESSAVRPGFDRSMAGKQAECEGGGAVAGTKFAGRQEFSGSLTGEYVDHGDPPWRWYLMRNLSRVPEGYTEDTVWCESGSLFLASE